MHFRIKKDVFAAAVSEAAKSTSPANTGGVLSGVLLETYENTKLRVSGYDTETASKSLVAAEVKEEGRVVVPARVLSDIVRALPSGEVEVKLEESKVVVTAGSARFQLQTLPVEEYQELPKFPAVSGKVAADTFAAAVAQVAMAAGKGSELPVLTGVRMEVSGDKLTLVATDRYRLAVRTISWEPTDPEAEMNILVPAAALMGSAKSFAQGGTVQIGINTNPSLVGFANADKALITRPIEGEFPRYKGLLPEEFSAKAVVTSSDLKDVLKRALLVVGASQAVRLSFKENSLVVEAGDADTSRHDETLAIEYTGEEFTIAFNPMFLSEAIDATGAERVTLSLNGAQKPAIVTGVGATDKYQHLLMPVRIT